MKTKISKIITLSRNQKSPRDQNGLFLPTLWLLGKTGAGKSSLIQTLTGDSRIEIGNGFQPCTLTSQKYDFPKDQPLLRFLDTRGLAEAHYDAKEDVETCEKTSHALLLVMKADEPEQSSVLNALKTIRKSKKILYLLVVHTGIMQIENNLERQQCIAYNQKQAEKIWGKKRIDSVAVEFDTDGGLSYGVEDLKKKLIQLLPIVAVLGVKQQASTEEEQKYLSLRPVILTYSSVSGGTDLIPIVGFASVPIIQIKMLHCLANEYGICWNRRTLAEFLGAFGAGFSIQYLSKLGLRELVKLIPGYGQTVGAVTAAVLSFMTTYALGRAGCYYFYARIHEQPLSENDLKDVYVSAFEHLRQQEA